MFHIICRRKLPRQSNTVYYFHLQRFSGLPEVYTGSVDELVSLFPLRFPYFNLLYYYLTCLMSLNYTSITCLHLKGNVSTVYSN